MKVLSAIVTATAMLASIAIAQTNSKQSMNETPSERSRSGYAPVNGLKIYFEVHGVPRSNVPPLVLLHGGGDTIETSFGRILPLLARDRQVVAFEQRGFGHTADDDRPFGFEDSADDTAALLDYLQIERADLFGFSNGGSIALHVAIRHPNRVRRLVVCTAIMKRAWVAPQFWEAMKTAEPTTMPAELRDAYLKAAPHPENLESFFYKCRNRMRDFQDVPDAPIQAIKAPTLVLSSDRDVQLPEGAIALSRLLPHAQLAILPGVQHMQITTKTSILVPMISEFLDAPDGR
ncbi:MAG TPA: alpha/beta hydrolase [Opitutaceae bacterium]|nr:alpha/beta hydrolase [Opitutaceae bacterium]